MAPLVGVNRQVKLGVGDTQQRVALLSLPVGKDSFFALVGLFLRLSRCRRHRHPADTNRVVQRRIECGFEDVLREVIQTAQQLGNIKLEWVAEITAGGTAENELGISKSLFFGRIKRAQQMVFEQLLAEAG